MLDMILRYMPVLGVAILCNIVLGMYNNINLQNQKFDFKKLIVGLIKSIIVASSFIGLAYCFDMTKTAINIGAFELTPDLIMTSAIAIYMTKDTIALANILGVKKNDTNSDKIAVASEDSKITIDVTEQKDPLERM